MACAAQQSFVDGRQQAMWAGVAVMGTLLAHVLARGPRTSARVTSPVDESEATAGAVSA
ncbi:hypothetical protein ACFVAQ_41050 [Streptomyces sp. NPDC057651]|uniref:hypothetical protein n=1 Tax=Streptomyces sp. NPDC057651 TaxID=3346194 RepID=UPI0036A7C321